MSHDQPYVSFSRLALFDTCPKAFEFRYRQRVPTEAAEPALLGTAVHKAAESLIRDAIVAGRVAPLSRELAERFFAEAWVETGLTSPELFRDGLTMVLRLVQDEGIFDPKSVLGIEVPFDLTIGGHRVVGYIDRVNQLDGETIEIQDYKSNRQLYTRDELDESLQMSMYGVAARRLWPWAKTIRFTFRMLRHGVRQRTVRTNDELDVAERYVATMADVLEGATEYPAKPGTACVYCDYRGRCDAYADAVKGKRTAVCHDVDDLESVGRERAEVARIAKVAYARKEELDRILKAHLKEKDELTLDGVRYSMLKTESKDYPIARTAKILAEATGQDVDDVTARLATVDKDALASLVKEAANTLPKARIYLMRAELDAVASCSYSGRLWAKEVKPCAA